MAKNFEGISNIMSKTKGKVMKNKGKIRERCRKDL